MYVHLWHGKAELFQFDLTYQWYSDSVGQHHITADNILNHVVGEATVNEKKEYIVKSFIIKMLSNRAARFLLLM